MPLKILENTELLEHYSFSDLPQKSYLHTWGNRLQVEVILYKRPNSRRALQMAELVKNLKQTDYGTLRTHGYFDQATEHLLMTTTDNEKEVGHLTWPIDILFQDTSKLTDYQCTTLTASEALGVWGRCIESPYDQCEPGTRTLGENRTELMEKITTGKITQLHVHTFYQYGIPTVVFTDLRNIHKYLDISFRLPNRPE